MNRPTFYLSMEPPFKKQKRTTFDSDSGDSSDSDSDYEPPTKNTNNKKCSDSDCSDSDSSDSDSSDSDRPDTPRINNINDLMNFIMTKGAQPITTPITKSVEPCPNPECDHLEGDIEMVLTPSCIETISQLINLGKLYHCKNRRTYYGINLRIICKLTEPLKELDNVIGMDDVKLDIVQQILHFTQPIENKDPCKKCDDCLSNDTCMQNINVDMLHSIVSGPPGVGKTMLAKILCKIYASMGILSKGTFTVARRSDLIGKYLGHTAVQTQKIIDSCEGGMLFIDEAYSLGSPEGRDSFAKECVDTITLNLSEDKKKNFILFIAGYTDALNNNLFSQNEGLRRRFSFEYNIQPYSGVEITKILVKMMELQKWKFDMKSYDELEDFMVANQSSFKYNGGDAETLLLNTKIHRNKRLLFSKNIDKKLITVGDIKLGYDAFIRHRKIEKDVETTYNFMYA